MGDLSVNNSVLSVRILAGDFCATNPRILESHQIYKEHQATVEILKPDAVLLRLHSPFDYDNKAIEYAVASVRLEGDTLTNLEDGEYVLCNVTFITKERATSEDPLDLSWWRGGGAMITSIAKA